MIRAESEMKLLIEISELKELYFLLYQRKKLYILMGRWRRGVRMPADTIIDSATIYDYTSVRMFMRDILLNSDF
jgi:hypothetical protein